MSVSTTTLKRLDKIKDGIIEGLNRRQIGDKIGVSERTIRRDIRAWVESGLFEVWLKEEFLRLHSDMIHENPELAYQQIAKLVGHMFTRKIERKEQIEVSEKVEIDLSVFSDDEKSILDRAARVLEKKSKGKSDSIH
jgi:DNA-binding transcriptional regulator LsrR (DeoR family)